MKAPAKHIAQNTVLNIFQAEERLLSKKELVKESQLPNRVIKDTLSDLVTEQYLAKEGSKFRLIKSFKQESTELRKTRISEEIRELFRSVRETDPVLSADTIHLMLEGKFSKQQIYNAVSTMISTGSLKKVDTGKYSLPNNEKKKKQKHTSYIGIAKDIRAILEKLPKLFTNKDVSKILEAKYTPLQISNCLIHLASSRNLVKVGWGTYAILHEQKEISSSQALEEKKEDVIRKKEISCTEALEKSRTFVRLQLGYKKLDGDYALVVKFGGSILKKQSWEKLPKLTMTWLHELKRMRIFPASSGYKMFLNDHNICEVVFPLPEGTDYLFPKPISTNEDTKHTDVNIPMANVTQGKDQDIIISLSGVEGIEYV